MSSQLFTPLRITSLAAVESLLVPRLFPELLETRGHLSLVLIIFAINYAVLGIYLGLIYPFALNPLRHLPGPQTAPTLVIRSLLSPGKPPCDFLLDVMRDYPHEDVLCLNIFQNELLITGPKALADLLVSHSYDFIKPGKISSFLKHILGDGLVVVEGDQHKFLRKNSQPAFSFRHIKNLYPMMWGKAIMLTRAVKGELSDGTGEADSDPSTRGLGTSGRIELSTWASRVTLDIIGSAGLGREFNTLEKAEDPLLNVYEELLEPSTEKILYFIVSATFGLRFVQLLPWKMNEAFRRLTASLNDMCRPLLQDKRDKIVKQADGHFDVLSLLIRSDNFSDRELTDQLLTYLAAGHETTSSSLTWACYLLSRHQDIQEIVRKEVRDALPSGTSLETLNSADLGSTLEQLPYLNAVINETLRLYPTVPVTRRECIRDTTIAGHRIPKGTSIIASPWAVNRSPETWGEDATQFRPERWITDGKPNQTGGAASNYHFLTFLHGPRSCIGQGFARAEMRCLLAAMVGAFSWELAMEDAKVIPNGVITIKPVNGLYLRLKAL